MEKEFNKYRLQGDYHWRAYGEETLYRLHVKKVLNFFKDKKGTLLDVGCGDGLILNELNKNKNLDCFGIDISKTGIEMAKNKGVINCEVIDLFDFNGIAYDYIFAGDLLEHLPDSERGLEKIREFLKPEGTLLIVMPIQKKKNRYDFHLFTKESARKLIDKFFKILSFEERLDLKRMYFVVKKK